MPNPKTKVYRVTLMIVDHDRLGPEAVTDTIENVHYPNHCIAPSVVEIEERSVDWSDDHPLNGPRANEAFTALFEEKHG